ncbi:MAG: hypothetical protein A2203_14975, partial [Chromatiales bacterium RIFOXYA1_FULL_46_5]
MEINAIALGQFILLFAFSVGAISYYLGRRKTQRPVLAALLGVLVSVVPLLALMYLLVLLFKNDLDATAEIS